MEYIIVYFTQTSTQLRLHHSAQTMKSFLCKEPQINNQTLPEYQLSIITTTLDQISLSWKCRHLPANKLYQYLLEQPIPTTSSLHSLEPFFPPPSTQNSTIYLVNPILNIVNSRLHLTLTIADNPGNSFLSYSLQSNLTPIRFHHYIAFGVSCPHLVHNLMTSISVILSWVMG